ncbi:nucleoside monophosphate kinase [Candidatus Woesearchaeota archaeon]|nr:nucleoside monophosphate kinase [Candidatus Woesearchaeota archaeon]
MKAILIFGPPGAGKGTQGILIGKKKGYFHISTGDIFRYVEHHGEIGKKVKKYLEKRELVPDSLAMKLFDAELKRLVENKAFDSLKDIIILDGMPRDRKQVREVNKRFDVVQIILLHFEKEGALINRILKRAKKEKREDDQDMAVIKHGIDVYHKKTEEILREYPKSIILRVDGSGSIAQIHKEIMKGIFRASS